MSTHRTTTLVLLALAALLTGIGVWFGQREEAAREEAAAPTPDRRAQETNVLATTNAPDSNPRALAAPDASVVTRPTATRDLIRGIVLRANGQPATQAHVLIDGAFAPTNEQGEFELRGAELVNTDQPLYAIEEGSLPAVIASFDGWLRASPRPLPRLELVLGSTPLSLRGRVVDSEFKPLPGWYFALLDPTRFSRSDNTAEALMRAPGWRSLTDEKGEFTIDGLLPRTYRVQVYNEDSLVRVDSQPIPAGASGVDIVVPDDALIDQLTGRLIGHDGLGISGAQIDMKLRVAYRSDSNLVRSTRSWVQSTVITDPDGMFTLTAVPRRHAVFDISGAKVVRRLVPVDELNLASPVIVVHQYCPLQVVGLPPGDGVRYLRAVTTDGTGLTVQFSTAGALAIAADARDVTGLELSDAATELILGDILGTDFGRRPVALTPGVLTTVKW
ncbi:MAG: carboxypeptidase regulatory-like domain-containing protein [Planctomycetes bacterium]|nr:carboxypeptidase regulatory-like domain-containing protein [Planctomycetota bacterium]